MHFSDVFEENKAFLIINFGTQQYLRSYSKPNLNKGRCWVDLSLPIKSLRLSDAHIYTFTDRWAILFTQGLTLLFFVVCGWVVVVIFAANRRMRTRSTSCCAWRCMVKWKRFQFTPLISCKDIPRAPVPRSETKVSPRTHHFFRGHVSFRQWNSIFPWFFPLHISLQARIFGIKYHPFFFDNFFCCKSPIPKLTAKAPEKYPIMALRFLTAGFQGEMIWSYLPVSISTS